MHKTRFLRSAVAIHGGACLFAFFAVAAGSPFFDGVSKAQGSLVSRVTFRPIFRAPKLAAVVPMSRTSLPVTIVEARPSAQTTSFSEAADEVVVDARAREDDIINAASYDDNPGASYNDNPGASLDDNANESQSQSASAHSESGIVWAHF